MAGPDRRLRPGRQPRRPVRARLGRRAAGRGRPLAPRRHARPGDPDAGGRAVPLRARPAPAVHRDRSRRARLGVAGQPLDGALPARARGAAGAPGRLAVGLLPAGRRDRVPVGRGLRPRLLHVLRGRRPRRAAGPPRLAARLRAVGRRRPRGRARHPPGAAPHGPRAPHQRAALPLRTSTPAGATRRCGAALRAGLGARMLVSYVSGRVARRCAASSAGPTASAAPPGCPARRSWPGRAVPPARGAPGEARGDHGRRAPARGCGRCPGRSGPSSCSTSSPTRGGGAHSLLAEAFARLEAVLPAERIWVCTAARYGEQVRAALPRLRRRPAGARAGRPRHRQRGRADRGAGRRRRPGRRARGGQRRPRHPPGRALRRGPAHRLRRARRPAALAGDPRHPAHRAGDRLRLRAPRAGRRRCPASPRPRRSWRSPTSPPPRATSPRASTCGTRGCSSGGRGPCSTRWPTTSPRAPRGWRGSSPRRPGPRRDAVLAEVFPTLPKISVDYAVLEPAAREPGRVLVADLDVDWLDVGSWPALAQTLETVGGERRPRAGGHPRRRRQHRLQRRPRAPRRPGRASATAWSCTPPTSPWSAPSAEAERVKQLLAEVEAAHGPRFS